MISYNPKEWLSFIYRFHRSDTIRRLFPSLIAIGLYSAGVAWLELEFWKIEKGSYVSNLTVIQSLLGLVLSLLLVFRTNTAYDRWWEGRKLWGLLVNSSRNLAIKMNAILPYEDRQQRKFFAKTIPLFARVLKDHLRSEVTRLALDENEHPELKGFDTNHHAPNQVNSALAQRIYKLHREGLISGDQLITINAELQSFADICGACERIKNTPIPYSYSAFIKKFIFFYVITLPFGFVFSLGFFVIPVSIFVLYALASLEVIAEEIEDPFGGDTNDLPTDKIALNIDKHVKEIFHIVDNH